MAKSVLQEKQVLLSWSLLFILLLLLVLFVILPTLSYSQVLEEKIDSGYQRLARYHQVAEATPEYIEEFKRVQRKGLDKLFYSEGMTSAQVAKELQKQLATIITRNEGVLIRSEVLDTRSNNAEEDAPLYQQVTVRADLQGNNRLLRSLLHQAYQARPLIFVESLNVKPLDSSKRSTNKQQQVKVDVVISTYWRGGGDEKMD